ncbi:MAG TPA: HemK2/MTQ2 family protein methyltransferase [Nitrososphaera sp.]|nr:HemK2/MTQ2 family protein methyltransferase [Nitrososphaera sp.]
MVYAPSEDSFLLAECVMHYKGKMALEIGVGSGIVLESLGDCFEFIAGTDIDVEALRLCKGRKTNAALVCCDACSAFAQVKKLRFDLIVTNPPYLPDDDKLIDRTVHGGPTGIEATVHFVRSAVPLLADGGKILVVVSSLADASGLDALLEREKLTKKLVKEKELFFEKLAVYELSQGQKLW